MRKSQAGCVAAVDDAVADVVVSLRSAGMYDNTLIVLSTDNGGPTDGADNNNMNNFPLRGCKGGYFDGGMRGVGLIHGVGLKKRGYVSEHLHHVVDWLPTLLTAAKQGALNDSTANHAVELKDGERPFLPGDGIDNWEALSTGAVSARTEIIHVVQAEGSVLQSHALRQGDMKILWHPAGTDCSKSHPGWYPPPNRSPGYANFTIKCSDPPTTLDACTEEEPCLFNISADPCEHKSIASQNQGMVKAMVSKLAEYRQHAILPWLNFVHKDSAAAAPEKHGPDTDGYQGVFAPWLTSSEQAKFYPSNYTGPGYPATTNTCNKYPSSWLPADGGGVIDRVDANTTEDGCCTLCAQRPGCFSAVWWGDATSKFKAGACILHRASGPVSAWTKSEKRTLVVPYGQGRPAIESVSKLLV